MDTQKPQLRLKELRLERGILATHIAKRLGKSPSWYHGIENGLTKLDVADAKIIAEIFGCSIEDLFADGNLYKKGGGNDGI